MLKQNENYITQCSVCKKYETVIPDQEFKYIAKDMLMRDELQQVLNCEVSDGLCPECLQIEKMKMRKMLGTHLLQPEMLKTQKMNSLPLWLIKDTKK